MRSTLPPRFKQSFAFKPFRLFHHLFRDNSNSISLRFGLPVYKWSPVYLTLVRRRMILHWQTTWSKRLNEGMLIKRFGVACFAIRSNNHCYQSVPRISIILRAQNRPVALWEGDLSHCKVYEGRLSYAEGSPLTLRNHFIQPYRVLDTLFSEYY